LAQQCRRRDSSEHSEQARQSIGLERGTGGTWVSDQQCREESVE